MRAANNMRSTVLRTDSKKKGLWQKFSVRKNTKFRYHDGDYFVLVPHRDVHALAALRAYAGSCAATNPQLAQDILAWLRTLIMEDP